MAFDVLPNNGHGEIKKLYADPVRYKWKLLDMVIDISGLIKEYNKDETYAKWIEELSIRKDSLAKEGKNLTKTEKMLLDNATNYFRGRHELEQKIISAISTIDEFIEYGKVCKEIPQACKEVNEAAEKMLTMFGRADYAKKMPKDAALLIQSYDAAYVADACTPAEN